MKAFADTFFFLAFLSPSDKWHGEAAAQMSRLRGKLMTTEFVLVELADAMADPRDRPACVEFINALRDDPDLQIIASTPELFSRGFELYTARPDKRWSLTDCISFVAMEQEHVRGALTGDRHFEQAGFVALLK